jgi:CubicO group peptidase (beta-lactamase class C family)
MKKFNAGASCRWVCLFLSCMSGCTIEAVAQAPKSFNANGRMINIADLNRKVERMMSDINIPGMSLAIISDNKIVFSNGYGVKKRGTSEKVDRSTVFDGCSLSKTFLAFVAFQLADEGKLDLDKPMYQYLEPEPLMYDPRYKLITSRMVLSHSSGIENWWSMNNPDSLEILSNPGEKYIYSGEGYEYLGMIVKRLLNQTYEQFVTERVINKLGLKNTYLKYTEDSPANYATGHQMGGQQMVYKNPKTMPAAGNHFSAEDYAKLIVAIFNSENLNAVRKKDIVDPRVRMYSSDVFYAPGFEIVLTEKDTIIAHGGDKAGYKNMIFYSISKKCGFVFMTNDDRGKSMSAKLSQWTVGLDIAPFLESLNFVYDQYPTPTLDLLKIKDQQGYAKMLDALERLKKTPSIEENTMNVLAAFLRWYNGDIDVAKKLLEENIKLYPNSALSYYILGDIYSGNDDYYASCSYWTKSKELNFTLWDIDRDLKDCSNRIASEEARKDKFLARIDELAIDTIQAENYNEMHGIRTQATADAGFGHKVIRVDSQDWLSYKLNVSTPGRYLVTFRIMGDDENDRVELSSNGIVLASIDLLGATLGDNWNNVSAHVQLQPGEQTLKVNFLSAGMSLNWISFKYEPVVSMTK